MSSSPYLPTQLKEYMRKFQVKGDLIQLQQTINDSVNDVLKNKPEDPFSYLIGLLQKKSSPDIQIRDMELFEIISGQGFPVLKIKVTVTFFNKELKFYIEQPLGISSEENNTFDVERHGGKGLLGNIAYFNEKIRPVIKQRLFKCSQQQQIDSLLQKLYNEQAQSKYLYPIYCVSFSPSLIKNRIFCSPLYRIISETVEEQIPENTVPKFIVTCLQGGKAVGSKCKVFRYYVVSSSSEGNQLIQNVLQNVKKVITSGKGGEAALKFSPEGSFICPVDTILDNLKIIEEAINNAGAKQHVSIGLSWAADTLFSQDTKKYQLENPKTPFDNDQMIQYLFKLVTDKPLISYLQDPIASTEIHSWGKLKNKLTENQHTKSIKIGSRHGNLINLNDKQLKQKLCQLTLPVNEQSHPDLSTEERDKINQSKFKLDCINVRYTELITLSKLFLVYRCLKKTSTELILQDNSFGTYDTSQIDLAFGLGCWTGLSTINKFDKIKKIQRALQIVKELEQERNKPEQ